MQQNYLKSQPKKILHFITSLNVGGAENMLKKLINNDPRIQNEVIVLAPLNSSIITDNFLAKIHPLDLSITWKSLIRSPLTMYRIFKITRTFRPEVIVGWMYHAIPLAFITAKFFSKPIVFNIRQTLYDLKNEKTTTRLVIRLVSFLTKWTNSIIYNSDVSKIQHEKFGYNKKPSILIGNGFELELMTSQLTEFRSKIRKIHEIEENELAMAVIARFHPMKGHEFFLKSIKKFLQNSNEKIPLKIILAGNQMNLENIHLTQIIKELGLESHVQLIGLISNSAEILPAIDLLVSPSLWGEGFSNVIGEAIAANVLTISSNIGEASKLLDEQFIFEAGDVDGFLNRLKYFTKLSSTEKEFHQKKHLENFKKLYSIQEIANQYYALYRQL